MNNASKQVHHAQFGLGSTIADNGTTQVVRFSHGIEEVLSTELEIRLSVSDAIAINAWASPNETVLRIQAVAIKSVNDAWGVFSRSRIALLPHQLWVCHRALRQWPVRMLIADDVGLGKTVEAGLILWPLLASKKIRRLLILTPASLVEQWQYRMREMFDIRLSIYRPEIDTERADFWNTHQQVVASLPTLRTDRNGRHDRLLDASAWDMVLVDEAHHLYADENTGKTLGFQLLEKLHAQGKVESCVLFTGTPHRGKPYGFWSLMSLLDSNVFGPNKPSASQLQRLPEYLVRNCKQKAVDMQGNRLFQPIRQYPETYRYSSEEDHFYRLMTDFVVTGRAYASGLDVQSRNQVILVLIALQKLASSSVAAVRGALKTRQIRLHGIAAQARAEAESIDFGDESDNEIETALRHWMRESSKRNLQLMENEIQSLNELLQAAEAVTQETRIIRILEVIEQRFPNESVLLFTEYKATQALVASALMRQYGEDSVGFINGENRLSDVVLPNGNKTTLTGRRDIMAERFNSGRIRFLISTEAGGEGIDLQERCHCLIHVDLPWNPMRLHQRVGRLNRYGQSHSVQVVSLRNPDTIESMIWSKLEQKLAHIMRALGSAMDEPEDLLQLVLGMTNSSFFNELFGQRETLSKERLNEWFDEKTKTFGGRDALETVNALVGHAQSFELTGLKDVPPLDLPDLLPFFKGMLHYNNRRLEQNTEGLSFRTPENWCNSPAIKKRYEGLIFSRGVKVKEAISKIVGVGHPVFDQALDQARNLSAQACLISNLSLPLFVFIIQDRVTSIGGQIRSVVFGVELIKQDHFTLLRDWQIIEKLNSAPKESLNTMTEYADCHSDRLTLLLQAKDFLKEKVSMLGLPFMVPEILEFAAIFPNGLKDIPEDG